MNFSIFQSLQLPSQAPWLPEAAIQYWGLHIAWSLVLGSLTVLLGARCKFKLRGWVATAVAVWTLLPGMASPSYWLGLAFQSPSLMTVLLCVILAKRSVTKKSLPMLREKRNKFQSMLLSGAGVLLGWVLLGDTLAWWSVSIYAWGFSTEALALTSLLAFSLWCLGSRDHDVSSVAIGFSVVLLLYVLTRLPTGNLWDALLDPWLWLILQVMGLQMLIRRRQL